ncbi:MAG: hypothetical protein E7627_07105 [Ruminococcaceae bacterium]|nr:hypothetical protein [Oscillospiraceae bacterium]
MKRASILVLVLIILLGVIPTQVCAKTGDGFGTNINVKDSGEKWNIEKDGSGAAYDTVIVEYRLKGEGIRGIQGAWIAIDMTKLLLVDYAYDGYSINDEIIAGNLDVGKAPARFNNPNYYKLKEDVTEGRAIVDRWRYSTINFNLAATSRTFIRVFLFLGFKL